MATLPPTREKLIKVSTACCKQAGPLDSLVYELYELTDEEIKIVKGTKTA
jgi:hypothetical protein